MLRSQPQRSFGIWVPSVYVGRFQGALLGVALPGRFWTPMTPLPSWLEAIRASMGRCRWRSALAAALVLGSAICGLLPIQGVARASDVPPSAGTSIPLAGSAAAPYPKSESISLTLPPRRVPVAPSPVVSRGTADRRERASRRLLCSFSGLAATPDAGSPWMLLAGALGALWLRRRHRS